MKNHREVARAPMTVTRWIGDNPTYVLANSHVYDFLDVINEYWSSYWKLDAWAVPPQIKPKSEGRDKARDVAIAAASARIEVLQRAAERIQRTGDPVDLHAGGTSVRSMPESGMDATASDRLLWGTVIRRAIADYAQGIVSPYARDQRIALNAYLWIMGRRWVLRPGTDPENLTRSEVLHPAACPWTETGYTPSYLVSVPREGQVPTFPGLSEETARINRSVCFQAICDYLRLNANAIRYRLHLIPPSTLEDTGKGLSWAVAPGSALDLDAADSVFVAAMLPSIWDADD